MLYQLLCLHWPADDHGANDRCPACIENLVRERVVMGDEAPERCETEKEHDEDGGHPPVAVWQHNNVHSCTTTHSHWNHCLQTVR